MYNPLFRLLGWLEHGGKRKLGAPEEGGGGPKLKRAETPGGGKLWTGPAPAAAERRERAVMVEAVMARERWAEKVCRRQGRSIVRRDFELL